MTTKLSAQQIKDLFAREFPQLHEYEYDAYRIEEVFDMGARMRLIASDRHLRPGGTISGPAMMTLADLAIYCAILGQIGPKALTVTTNFNINFMRKPEFGDLLGEAKIMKLGKQLVVCECDITSIKSGELVAHVTGTYSIPPQNR